jgi:hypothetical protein
MKNLLALAVLFLTGGFSVLPPPIALQGYSLCAGAVIEGTDKGLACYALARSNCRNGPVVLAYEQLANKAQGRPAHRIVDTVHVRVDRARQALSITTCAGPSGQRRSYVVLAAPKQPGKYVGGIQRAWTYNAQDKLTEVPVKMVQCLNNDYGAQ